MILPLITPTPDNNEVINLAQLIQFRQPREDYVELTLTGGVKRIYNGDAARAVLDEIAFAILTYRDFRKGIEAARQQQHSNLIVPSNGKIN